MSAIDRRRDQDGAGAVDIDQIRDRVEHAAVEAERVEIEREVEGKRLQDRSG